MNTRVPVTEPQVSQGISRRQFLRLSAATAGAALALGPISALPAWAESEGADEDINALPATLFDASRCVGCGSCQRACIDTHNLHPTREQTETLSHQNFTVVKEVQVANGETRHVKTQCMHCLEPACVSACTVGALKKSAEGFILVDTNKCFGCRYCQYACPFNVPAFEWENALGMIRKCDFCVERVRAGQGIACAAACPSGALKVGTRAAMLAEAHGRIKAHPEHYVDHVYGEFEVGGTRRLYISDVPFEQLALPQLGTDGVPHKTEVVMTKTPVIAAGVAGVATAIYALLGRRNEKRAAESEGGEHGKH